MKGRLFPITLRKEPLLWYDSHAFFLSFMAANLIAVILFWTFNPELLDAIDQAAATSVTLLFILLIFLQDTGILGHSLIRKLNKIKAIHKL